VSEEKTWNQTSPLLVPAHPVAGAETDELASEDVVKPQAVPAMI
jgi:hypothetical protein